MIRLRRALQSPTCLARSPADDALNLFGEFEVLVGDALRVVGHQFDLKPCIGGRNIRMMPCGLGQMADRIERHQRALPAMGFVFASQPAVLISPVRKLSRQPRADLLLRIDFFFARHDRSPFRDRRFRAGSFRLLQI